MSHNGFSLYHLDGEAQELRDQGEPEGDVGLALRRTLAGPFQGEVVGGEQRRSLGRGAQALRAPDALVVALAEQPGQHPGGAGSLAGQSQPRHELDPIHGQWDVTDVTLRVGAHGIAEQLEYRLEELLPCEDVEGAARCRGGEIAAQALHEACPLALQRRQEREHLHGEDGRGVGSRIEDGPAVSLLKGFSASSLRRNCEMSLAVRCALPRSRGSSPCPPRASAQAAPSRPIRRAQRARPRSALPAFWNSASNSIARCATSRSGSSGSMRERIWNSHRSAKRNARSSGGQPSSSSRRYW